MIALLAALTLLATDAPTSDLDFAQSLYEEGDYYRAITEAKRHLFSNPDDAAARLLIGRAYLAGEQWGVAATTLEAVVRAAPQGPIGADAQFLLAEARFGTADYDLAALEYGHFAEDFADDPRKPAADVRVGWARLYAAEALSTREPKKGKTAFASVEKQLRALPADHPEHARIEKLASGAHRLSEMRRRSPAVAGVASTVLPGLGQVYAGRYADGLIAFVVNGLFIYGIYDSFTRHPVVLDNPTGIMLTLFESGWYTGNIYSAINSAHRHNNEARGAILKNMKKELWVQALPRPDGDGVVAALGGRF